VQQLQEEAELRVLDIEEGIQSYTDAVTARLILALGDVNQEFHERVEQFDEEARNGNLIPKSLIFSVNCWCFSEQEVERCIQEATEQLDQLDAEIIESTVEQLVKESRDVLQTAQELVQEAVDELERLRGEVDNCHAERCADDLAEEIELLQNKVAGDIAEALNTAHAIVEGLEADAAEFDIREYEEAVRGLVDQVALCARVQEAAEEDPREEEEERREEEEEERREEEEERRDE